MGVRFASFHLFLALISVTSCLQRKSEKVRKVRRRNGRPSHKGTEREMRGKGANENWVKEEVQWENWKFIKKWRRGEKRSETIRGRELEEGILRVRERS